MNRLAMSLVLSAALVACGGHGGPAPRVAEAEKFGQGLGARGDAKLAPQAFAVAEQELRLAKAAEAKGDAASAELHADRALASYQHATVLARLSRASQELSSANEALARASEQKGRFATQRAAIDRDTVELEKQLKVTRDAELPASSGPADPERERARVVAAQTLATQARLLCSAARLLAPSAPGLTEAEAATAAVEKELGSVKAKAPIDGAARARAGCLGSLDKARRTTASSGDAADALLGELSLSGAAPKADGATPSGDLSPSRDERGVVVTLRGIFQGDKLTKEGEQSLKDLGRVAAAHPTFAVQVVVHDATPPGDAAQAIDKKRGEVAAQALTAGGAAAEKLKVEQAGARTPVVDPNLARLRARNERLEIVFVAPGA